MGDPQSIDDVEHPDALHQSHLIVAELLLLVIVSSLGQLHQVIDDFLAVHEVLDLVPREVLRHGEDPLDLLAQRLHVPVAPVAGQCIAGQLDERLLDPLHDERLEVFFEQHAIAIAINNVALAIEHVIVFDHVFADVEVVRLDFLLRIFDRPRYPRVLERHVFLEAELVHQTGDRRTTESTHQLVFQ